MRGVGQEHTAVPTVTALLDAAAAAGTRLPVSAGLARCTAQDGPVTLSSTISTTCPRNGAPSPPPASRNADGSSRISAEDFAVAVLDEIENPCEDRHFTVGY